MLNIVKLPEGKPSKIWLVTIQHCFASAKPLAAEDFHPLRIERSHLLRPPTETVPSQNSCR
jgi:hypothetical protein